MYKKMSSPNDKLDLCKIGNDFISKIDERYNQFGRFTEVDFI